ncbi:MAG: hypothetical protein U1E27_06400, partial [Kiritimatiellia bacterium]|nr:hypothetical protein [Kiritimatiellia bacterium]
MTSYSGSETGAIRISAEVESNTWTRTWSESQSDPGAYTNWVANQTGYWFKAYMDVDGSGDRNVWEPWGVHANWVAAGTQDVAGVDIVLQDQPSIWGTLTYTGSATGDVHILAVTGDEWVREYRAVLPWIKGYGSTTGDPLYLTFPVSYSIVGLPPGNYRIRAFMDENGDGQRTALEPDGQYAPTLISFTNRMTGVNFTLGLDSNTNGIPDWWELQHFGGATNAVAGADPDGEGRTNLQEYMDGTDPNNPDSDGDGFTDEQESGRGTNPTDPLSFPQEEWFAVHGDHPPGVTKTHQWIQTIPAGETRELILLGDTGEMGFSDPDILSWTISTNGASYMSGTMDTDQLVYSTTQGSYPDPMAVIHDLHYGFVSYGAYEIARGSITAPTHSALTVTLALSVQNGIYNDPLLPSTII